MPDAVAVTAGGQGVSMVDGNSDGVTPITAATGRADHAVPVGFSTAAVTMSGSTAYVVSTISGTVTPLSVATGRVGSPISVGVYSYPTAMTLADAIGVVLDTYAARSRCSTPAPATPPPR